MKKIFWFILLVPILIIGQDNAMHTAEFRITLINTGSSWNVTFVDSVIGDAWWNENFDLTTDYGIDSVIVVGQQPPPPLPPIIPTANFDLVNDPLAGINPIMAIGLYKISAYENGVLQAYFYMDWRTTDFSTSPDVNFKYDVGLKRFKDNSNITIINYSTQTIWDLVDGISQVTTDFEPFSPVNVNVSNFRGRAKITWQRQSQDDYVTGYDVYRSFTNPNIGYSKIASTTNTNYVDNDVTVGPGSNVYYKTKAINGTKESVFSNYDYISYSGLNKSNGKQDSDGSIENSYYLMQNYPNPFNPTTIISYKLKEKNNVTIKVYSVLGKEVAELVNKDQESGLYQIEFNASNLPSGIYIYKITAGKFSEVKKMQLIK